MLIFTCDHSEPRVSCYVFMISGLLIRKSGALLLHTLAVKWISLAWPENSQEALRNARVHFLIHTQLRADKEMWCRYFCHWSKIEVKQSLMSFFFKRWTHAGGSTQNFPATLRTLSPHNHSAAPPTFPSTRPAIYHTDRWLMAIDWALFTSVSRVIK